MLKYESYHFGENNLFAFYNPNDLNYPKHLHRSFEFVYVTNGAIEILVNNRTFHVGKGSSILIFPYEVHSIATREHSSANICVFPPEYVNTFHNMIDGKTLENPVFDLSAVAKTLILDKIFENNWNILEMKACLYLLCSEVMETTTLIDSIKPDYELLHKILSYRQENFTQDISLKTISTQFGYSYTYLSKYLNNILGISFVDFINENRINYALYLLKNTQNTITDIAYTCGYSSIRSFNRNFLKIAKNTPKCYRNS